MKWCPVYANNRQGYQTTDQFLMIVRVKYLKIICVLNVNCKFAQDEYRLLLKTHLDHNICLLDHNWCKIY
jgi:hypothetical protein